MTDSKHGGPQESARIGELIRKARVALHWTQEYLANELSQELGLTKPLSVQAISKWENGGTKDFTASNLAALTKVLQRRRDYFEIGSEENCSPERDNSEQLESKLFERLGALEQKVTLMWGDVLGRLDRIDKQLNTGK